MSTWQRPQMPRPPQTESTSTPSVRAAERSGVPAGKRPRLPEGMKTTSGSLAVMGRRSGAGRAAPLAAAADGLALGARRLLLAELRDPVFAVRVVAHHHVRAEAGTHGLGVQRVRDRRSEARGDRHGEEGAVDAVAVRQAEADVRGAAGRVDPELLAQAAHEPHHLPAGGVDGATGMTSGSTTTSLAGMPWSAARSTIFFATAKRTSGSSEIPVSSFEIATTAAPYFRISGSTASRRSSSPVTELTRALPW